MNDDLDRAIQRAAGLWRERQCVCAERQTNACKRWRYRVNVDGRCDTCRHPEQCHEPAPEDGR